MSLDRREFLKTSTALVVAGAVQPLQAIAAPTPAPEKKKNWGVYARYHLNFDKYPADHLDSQDFSGRLERLKTIMDKFEKTVSFMEPNSPYRQANMPCADAMIGFEVDFSLFDEKERIKHSGYTNCFASIDGKQVGIGLSRRVMPIGDFDGEQQRVFSAILKSFVDKLGMTGRKRRGRHIDMYEFPPSHPIKDRVKLVIGLKQPEFNKELREVLHSPMPDGQFGLGVWSTDWGVMLEDAKYSPNSSTHQLDKNGYMWFESSKVFVTITNPEYK